MSDPSPSENPATPAFGHLTSETISRREHDEGVALEKRLSTLETKVNILMAVVGPTLLGVVWLVARTIG